MCTNSAVGHGCDEVQGPEPEAGVEVERHNAVQGAEVTKNIYISDNSRDDWDEIYGRGWPIPHSFFPLSGEDLLANCYEAHDRNQATQPEVRVKLKG